MEWEGSTKRDGDKSIHAVASRCGHHSVVGNRCSTAVASKSGKLDPVCTGVGA